MGGTVVEVLSMSEIWGYLREDAASVSKAGVDKATGLHRTSLKEYLRVIFPDTDDWVHNKCLPKDRNDDRRMIRPDYRSESLNRIVEFDGLPHFQYPSLITDLEKTEYYQRMRYKVVRIPYFIQLTNVAVKILFGKDVEHELFDGSYPSLNLPGKWMPSHICPLGLMRMALEFVRFPDQYQVNKTAMMKISEYTGWRNLDGLYQDFRRRYPNGIEDPSKLLTVVKSCKISIG